MQFEGGTLPLDKARIAFRDVTSPTNTRTTICCLLPPGVSTVHKAPLLVRRGGDASSEAYLLGVMSSIPFDWVTRRWIELTMSFELLISMPVPMPTNSEVVSGRVVEIAGRLAAFNERFAGWAAEVGVPVDSVESAAERDALVAELDALVSLLYGLTESQVRHVFATFHRGWNYEARLDAVITHYREWRRGKA